MFDLIFVESWKARSMKIKLNSRSRVDPVQDGLMYASPKVNWSQLHRQQSIKPWLPPLGQFFIPHPVIGMSPLRPGVSLCELEACSRERLWGAENCWGGNHTFCNAWTVTAGGKTRLGQRIILCDGPGGWWAYAFHETGIMPSFWLRLGLQG